MISGIYDVFIPEAQFLVISQAFENARGIKCFLCCESKAAKVPLNTSSKEDVNSLFLVSLPNASKIFQHESTKYLNNQIRPRHHVIPLHLANVEVRGIRVFPAL